MRPVVALFKPSAGRSLAETGRERRAFLARILVTGAAGFIGAALCRDLVARGHGVRAATRSLPVDASGVEPCAIGDIGPDTDWSTALSGIEIVIHLANRAHQPAGSAGPALAREPAAAGHLASAAVRAGTRRFVQVSSVKAMGEATRPGQPFRPEDPPSPADAYGRVKLATEDALRGVAGRTDIELVIVRPPLVHGPGVAANFRALVRLAASGLPLPFAGIDNRRSLICRDNLIDLLATAATHPNAPGRILLVRDPGDLSTPALIRVLAAALDRPARLFPMPLGVFAGLRRVPRLGPVVARLTASLQVDDAATRADLGWSPPVDSAAGLAATARAVHQAIVGDRR